MKISYRRLWKLLLDHNIKKAKLKDLASIGQATMTKLNKDQTVSMEVLIKICKVLQCDIGDIVQVIDYDSYETGRNTEESRW